LSSGKIKKKDPLTKREREAIKEVEKVLGGKKEGIGCDKYIRFEEGIKYASRKYKSCQKIQYRHWFN